MNSYLPTINKVVDLETVFVDETSVVVVVVTTYVVTIFFVVTWVDFITGAPSVIDVVVTAIRPIWNLNN